MSERDLVERLRYHDHAGPPARCDICEAADEIEREREAYDTLTKLLQARFPAGSDYKVENVLRENAALRQRIEAAIVAIEEDHLETSILRILRGEEKKP